VLLDATLIRSILVPASMALLGRMNWYLPAVLRKILPKLQLEGPRTKPVLPPV
jgi:RND superfamily putative drug exporter